MRTMSHGFLCAGLLLCAGSVSRSLANGDGMSYYVLPTDRANELIREDGGAESVTVSQLMSNCVIHGDFQHFGSSVTAVTKDLSLSLTLDSGRGRVPTNSFHYYVAFNERKEGGKSGSCAGVVAKEGPLRMGIPSERDKLLNQGDYVVFFMNVKYLQ